MNNLLNLKNIFVNASLLGLLLISGANPALAADQAAFVYVAHKNDYGWSYSHDIGRLKAEKSLQGKFKTSYIENILDNADSERTFRRLAQQGNKVIFATTFGYIDVVLGF